MYKGYFVTGTGTDVGKTYVTALLIQNSQKKGISTGYFKAALSGDNQGVNDAAYVKNHCKLKEPVNFFVPYIYDTAVSPHLAGKIENHPLELAKVEAAFSEVVKNYDIVIAEGSGGILCPLRWDEEKILLEDVIKFTEFPLVIVANAEVGTINATALTVEYAKKRSLNPIGIILNYFNSSDPVHCDNRAMIEEITHVPVVATVEKNGNELKKLGQSFL